MAGPGTVDKALRRAGASFKELRALACDDWDCSSFAPATTLTTLSGAGQNPSMALGADGYPVISYYNSGSGGRLEVAHCDTDRCDTATWGRR